MAKTTPSPKVLTGNRLRDGRTVYYTGTGWSLHAAEAKIAATAEDAEVLAKVGAAAHADNYIVDIAVIDVNQDSRPVRLREIIRATGPTVRPDLGKSINGQR
jgi:hypothetical protein